MLGVADTAASEVVSRMANVRFQNGVVCTTALVDCDTQDLLFVGAFNRWVFVSAIPKRPVNKA